MVIVPLAFWTISQKCMSMDCVLGKLKNLGRTQTESQEGPTTEHTIFQPLDLVNRSVTMNRFQLLHHFLGVITINVVYSTPPLLPQQEQD